MGEEGRRRRRVLWEANKSFRHTITIQDIMQDIMWLGDSCLNNDSNLHVLAVK